MKNVFKAVLVMLLCVGATGCATQSASLDLSRFGNVEKEPWESREAIKSVEFTLASSVDVEQDRLAMCVAENVTNRSVTLSDNAGSHFGAVTGTYYNQSNQQSVAGGQTIIREGEGKIVAEGLIEYSASTFVNNALRFTLIINTGDSNNSYRFANLQRAQLGTGTLANTGFGKIGAWPAAKPEKAIQSLESLAVQINSCLL